MPVKVADTSVIAAIAFKESRAHEARALLGSSVIVAPTLLGYELANVARTKSLKAPHKESVNEAPGPRCRTGCHHRLQGE